MARCRHGGHPGAGLLFTAVYEQTGQSLLLWARDCTRRSLFGHSFPGVESAGVARGARARHAAAAEPHGVPSGVAAFSALAACLAFAWALLFGVVAYAIA